MTKVLIMTGDAARTGRHVAAERESVSKHLSTLSEPAHRDS